MIPPPLLYVLFLFSMTDCASGISSVMCDIQSILMDPLLRASAWKQLKRGPVTV